MLQGDACKPDDGRCWSRCFPRVPRFWQLTTSVSVKLLASLLGDPREGMGSDSRTADTVRNNGRGGNLGPPKVDGTEVGVSVAPHLSFTTAIASLP